MVVLNVLIGVLCCLWLYYLWSQRKFYALSLKVPTVYGLPFLGLAYKTARRKDVLPMMEKFHKQNKSLMLVWLGPFAFLLTSHSKTIEEILGSSSFTDKSVSVYSILRRATGFNLITLNNPKWYAHRKLINPCFTHKVLINFIPTFNNEADILLNDLKEVAGKGDVDIQRLIHKAILRVSAQTTMGSLPKKSTNDQFLETVQYLFTLGSKLLFEPWLRIEAVFHMTANSKSLDKHLLTLDNYILRLIEEKVLIFNKKKDTLPKESEVNIVKNSNIFIDEAVNLVSKGKLTVQEVRDESSAIIMAAYDTSSVTMLTILICLATFLECQDRLYEEIITIFPDEDSEITYEDLEKLKYTEMVMNEALRLFSTVPFVARTCTKDFKLSNGIMIPKGTEVAIDIYHLHRDKDVWGPDAHTFNPERFLPENLVDKERYAFIPFSKGVRNCIGWRYAYISIKILLVKLFRTYRITTKHKFEDLRALFNITLTFYEIPKFELNKR